MILHIRPITLDNAADCAAVRHYYLRQQTEMLAYCGWRRFPYPAGPAQTRPYFDFLKQRKDLLADDFHIWLLYANTETPIGFAQAKTRTVSFPKGAGYIDHLYIHPLYRGQGLARQTMNALEDTLISKACDQAILAVAAKNRPAVSLYQSMGWQPVSLDVPLPKGFVFMNKAWQLV